MSRVIRFSGTFAVLAGLMSVSLAGLSLAVTPVAEVTGETPWAPAYISSQPRFVEAETKARLLNKAFTLQIDKTPAMDDYDARFYDLVLDLDPVTRILTGTTTLTADVLTASLTAIDVHFLAIMGVSQVTAGGVATTFSRDGDVLTVDLDRTYVQGETCQVTVTYSGNPAGDYFGWSSYGGQPLIWTLSEPYGAHHWWVCKDLNTDKPDSVALHVTVPEDLVVASNGRLDAVTVPSAGLKTYHWTERYPITTYLVSLAIHPYETVSQTYTALDGTTMPVVHYVVADRVTNAETYFPVTVEMLEAFALSFGEYPFVNEKYGHAHFPWGGGMEHQTLTSIHYNAYYDGIICHELGHQWFGDLVTCADFGHIWLNEGFATWCEARWREMNESVAAYHDEMDLAKYLGEGTIFVEDTSDVWGIFDSNLSYNKASWIPHMLRHMMGDETFFPALEAYLATYGFGSATTEQFRDLMAAQSGLDLDVFFQQWIYGEYYPQYRYSWQAEAVPGGTRVGLRIQQIQTNTGIFTMPLDVRMATSAGVEEFTVQNDSETQWYTFHVPGEVTDVEIDPDGWVLCTKVLDGVSDVPGSGAAGVRLVGNAPNPFNPATEITFVLDRDMTVNLAIFDMAGRRVNRLVSGLRTVGEHKVRWNGTDASGLAMASGTYFVRLSADGNHQVKSLVLVR